MSSYPDYITAIDQLAGGDLPLADPEKIFAINAAVKEYSRHRPRVVVEDEDGNGGFDYALSTLLASWTEGFSAVQSVEYPVDDTNETPSILDEDDWTIYQKPTGKVLRLLSDIPVATDHLRITYTTLHTCTNLACTVPAADEEAVQMLAAARFCDMLSTYYARTGDSSINADAVDHKSKGAEYAARARTYRRAYYDHLGMKEGVTIAAAAAVADLDVKYPGGGERLTHPRSDRKKR